MSELSKNAIQQYYHRNKKLKAMGLTYAEYLKSQEWADFKAYLSKFPQFSSCYCCGASDVELHYHHKKYKINKSFVTQRNHMVRLCKPCHELVHNNCNEFNYSLGKSVNKLRKTFQNV